METVRIPLTQGKSALVDAADVPLVAGYTWHAARTGEMWYAVTRRAAPPGRRRGQNIGMHRLLCDPGAGREVKHRNGDGLDNRRANLLVVTDAQMSVGRGLLRSNRSGYKGVSWKAGEHTWVACGYYQGRQYFLGRYDMPDEAARAYDRFVRMHFGDYARLNFPDET